MSDPRFCVCHARDRQVFHALDTDKDGLLSHQELLEALQQKGPQPLTQQQVQRLGEAGALERRRLDNWVRFLQQACPMSCMHACLRLPMPCMQATRLWVDLAGRPTTSAGASAPPVGPRGQPAVDLKRFL
jgi:hypothetical protein